MGIKKKYEEDGKDLEEEETETDDEQPDEEDSGE